MAFSVNERVAEKGTYYMRAQRSSESPHENTWRTHPWTLARSKILQATFRGDRSVENKMIEAIL